MLWQGYGQILWQLQFLQVTRTTIKCHMSSKFDQIRPCSAELATLDFVCLFDLILNVPVNNFSVMLGRRPIPGYYQYFWGVNCLLLKETNTPTRLRIEPGSPDPESDALTTRPVRPPATLECLKKIFYLLENYSKYFYDMLALRWAIVALWATCLSSLWG